MNLHHLELFYYVAKHGGIVRACREMPYGIQQPAVSSQLLSLEDSVGTKLFQRKPFALTPAGEHLFGFIAPFFNQLPKIKETLTGELGQEIRLAGSSELMRDFAPEIIHNLRKKYPKLRLSLTAANQKFAEELILKGDADLAVTVLEDKLAQGLKSKQLIELPLILLLPSKDRKLTDSQKILGALRSGSMPYPLVALPPKEKITRLFQETLKKRSLVWDVLLQANNIDLVAHYVAKGMGIGLSTAVPRQSLPKGVKSIALRGFPKLPIGAYWRGQLSPAPGDFLELLSQVATKLSQRVVKSI